ncbi:Pyridoxamine 5'-phosphate oxidase-related FMN-binding protein [Frankia canadensis]|uniref:Pyridoxamine 5'-phosphate oxidase-related FMN-binding protein n=1 Tax=Frankia canadensis TaxID=1836972 RepID=A0A2I2KM48_9ACTN|nr:pyridoxamine 5'-phosphate oxidase family protein [Frankia canadensis]SNQ46741.1 Pyridoxamine 5'-phosphate oxidase-related FMN-binding protein [Frankia canadensis]SOU54031.1 Pyridoxamine 5'-phosphate oxidase-related FMN-binding protein [Frankia canadensis]
MVTEQRRGRRIAMTPEERDAFLTEERTCRLASLDKAGRPHVSALWFAWDGTALWFNSLVRSQRWVNLEREPNVSVLVDAGVDYHELRGVEITGRVEQVGEVPRTGEPNDELVEPERLFGAKYSGGALVNDGRHAWLRLVPEKIVSWDFRKSMS